MTAVTFLGIDLKRLGTQTPTSDILPGGRYPYYVLVDMETDEELLKVDFPVKPGDEFLTGDNRLYRVESVEENRGYSAFLRYVKLKK